MSKKQGNSSVLGRDPFEGMDWSPDPEPEEESVSQEDLTEQLALLPGETTAPAPVGALRGKGVWLLYSNDIDLAIEMALAIGARHIFYKTGHRGMFFVEAAQRVHNRVRANGLIPFACPFIQCDDPIAEADVAIKSVQAGYDGVVFDIRDQAVGNELGAAALGQRVIEAGIHPEQLYYTSFPNIWQHLDMPYREMNGFCRGGFMPKCFPTLQRTPRTVIKKWAYGEHARWAKEWGNMPPLYPVLAAYRDEKAQKPLSVQGFLEWAQALTAHAPSFFSIYRAKTTPSDLWSILSAMGEEAPPPPAPPPEPKRRPRFTPKPTYTEEETEPLPSIMRDTPPQTPLPPELEMELGPVGPPPEYHLVTVNDTIRSLCERNGISREQFWEWNGHLWDDKGLPRDSLYMQEGWRVRIG